MAAPAQGLTFPGLPGELQSVKIKNVGVDPTGSAAKLDASTLDIAANGFRVYVKALKDRGPGMNESGQKTITLTSLSEDAPAAGQEVTYEGQTYKYTEVETESAVGELVKFTATLVAVPPEQ